MKTFAEFLPRFEQGIERFLNGDATLWKSNASHEADGTIMGAWDDYEKSWGELEPRYDWAAARFEESGATVQFQYLSSGVSGEQDGWKLLHRHADPLMSKTAPAEVLSA